MSERAKIRITLSPEAERYARRDAPLQVRQLASRGVLPLPPIELATVLFVLTRDPDAEIKDRARQSLENLPEGVRNEVLSGPAHPALLSWLGHAWKDHADRMERLALNPAADDATSTFLATLPHKRVVDIVANNQQRLLRCPDIVEALGANPLTGRAAIDRILSFLGLDRPMAEVHEEPEEDFPPPPEELTDAEAQAALRAVLGDDVSGFARELVDDGAELSDELRANLHAAIQEMSVFQKIKLARMGNKEARGILVRDRNKIVATAAIRSPKITELEVIALAKSRNVSDEVLRLVAANRDWTRNYQVKLGLATNPRCPQPTAMKFLNYLQDRELRSIMRSKDVPSAVSAHARRILTKKGKL